MIEFKKGQKLFFRNTGTTYIVVSTTDFKNISIKREGWLDGFYLLVSKKYLQERHNEGIISIVKERKMFNKI